MKQKNIYFFIAAALTTIVPVPGRFAFGVLMIVLFNVQIITSILMCHLITLLHLEDLKNVIVSITLIAVTIFFKQLLILYCPLAAFTLGFLLYLPALSSVIIEFSFKDTNSFSLAEDLRVKGIRNLVFSVFALVIYLIRDSIGYGTLTFPLVNKIATAHLSGFSSATYASAFVATIPGAFVLMALALALYIFIEKQCAKIEKSGGVQ